MVAFSGPGNPQICGALRHHPGSDLFPSHTLVSGLQALTGHREQSDHPFCSWSMGRLPSSDGSSGLHRPAAGPANSHWRWKGSAHFPVHVPVCSGIVQAGGLKPEHQTPHRPAQNADDGASPKLSSSAGLLRGPGICIPTRG